jgi:CHAT domain-containing protein
MDALYAALAAGSGKDDALQQAQILLLRQPAIHGAPATAHPYFWSPFVLVGDSRPLASARRA